MLIHGIRRPKHLGTFEFCCVAALRAKQLGRGCVPRVNGHHKLAITALLEVESGEIQRVGTQPMVGSTGPTFRDNS